MYIKYFSLFQIGMTFALLISANGVPAESTSGSVNTTSEAASTSSTTSTSTTSSTTVVTTTTTPEEDCRQFSHNTCEFCVKGHSTCYFCETTTNCTYFSSLIPGYEECGNLGDVKWATCSINFKVMIIATSTVGGLLILGIIICCCCCCKKRRKGLWSRDQAKWDNQREELKMRSDERKKERQSRTDQIRRKYGLMKDDTAYQRFDA